MKLYVIDNGRLEPTGDKIIDRPGADKEIVKVPINLFLIDTGDGYVLFDTGCPYDAMNGAWTKALTEEWPYICGPDQALEKQLALCGVEPKDIKTVVLSHFHLDHTGNLKMFEHATVYAPREDYLFGLGRVHASTDPEKHGGYVKDDLDVPVSEYVLVDHDMSLCEGIDLITLPGHASGLLGMVVYLESGTLILPQDAVYNAENYGPPAVRSGSIFNEKDYFESIEKVRNLAEKYNAQVWFGHDWELFNTLKHAPEYYE